MSSHTFNLKGAKFKDYRTLRENKKVIPYVKKTNTVALFTNARDEKYIKEWAAHHLLLGFDYIFITDHLSVIPLTSVLHNFNNRVIVSRYNKKNNIKIELMNKAIITAKKYRVDWFIYLDADEFIILNHKTITNIKEFLQVYNNADMVGVNWLMFGSNSLDKDPHNIIGHFTKSDLLLNNHIKSFVRTNEAINANTPHVYNIKNPMNFFCYNHRMCNITSYHDYNIPFFKAPIYIAHYVIQSKESYLRRRHNRPRDDSGTFRPKTDTNNIHLLYNIVDNLQPKTQYEHKIVEFFNRLHGSYVSPIPSISLEDSPPAEDTTDLIDSENTLNANDGRISEIHNS
jgi:hypothetical protein